MNFYFMIVLFCDVFHLLPPSPQPPPITPPPTSVVTSIHSSFSALSPSSSSPASHLFTFFRSEVSPPAYCLHLFPSPPCCPSFLLYLLHVTLHPLLPYSSHSCIFPFLLLPLFIPLSSPFSPPPPLNLSPPSSPFHPLISPSLLPIFASSFLVSSSRCVDELELHRIHFSSSSSSSSFFSSTCFVHRAISLSFSGSLRLFVPESKALM